MLDIGRKLLAKIHKQKHHAHHNHDVHFLARELNDWLVEGVHALIDGSYTPRFLKCCYFPDEMIDQLHLSDRIPQHVLLHQLKPTFPFVMNPNCYHLQDDILILCQTKRGLNRCKQHLMQVLQERRLRLSGKKTRIGSIDKSFHVLGIQYPKTQPLDNTTMTQAVVNVSNTGLVEQNQSKLGWV